MLWSGYDGANRSTARGEVWWPSLDTRDELDSFSRQELARRIHWLKANFGFIKGLIKNAADLCGYQTPQGQSGDEVWDEIAEERFRDVTGESEAFDVAGKFDFEDAQPMLLREALTEGDILTVMTKWPDGAARFAFYETHQLRNPKGAGKEWRDGIKVSRAGRHLAYGLYDPAQEDVVVIPAKDVIYFGEFDSPRQDRPVPPLAHAVNHSVDITETWGFVKKAIKTSSLFGTVRETAAQVTTRQRQGLTGSPRTATDAAGNRFKVADVWDGGQIPELDAGQSLKILHDERPSPNVQDFIRTLIRDISVGFGLPPEVVWEMIKMTGPGVRFVLDVADRWIKCRQKRQQKWARKVWRYVIACEIAAGRLRMPDAVDAGGKKRQKWWAVSFTSQRNLTIDRGQMSRAKLEELRAGVGTLSDWNEMDGRDWKDRGRDRIGEVAWLMKECEKAGVNYHEVFPPQQGAAVVQGSEEESPKKKSEDLEDEE